MNYSFYSELDHFDGQFHHEMGRGVLRSQERMLIFYGFFSFILSLFFFFFFSFGFLSDSTAATYNFTAPICTRTIIPLEPCALNAEFHTKCFFKIKFTDFTDTTLKGVRG
jgi:hypothetical protein